MWVYVFMTILCVLSISFFMYTLGHPYLKKIIQKSGNSFITGGFGLALGCANYFHMYYEPLGWLEKIMGLIVVLGIMYLHGVYMLHISQKASALGAVAVVSLITVHKGVLMLLFYTSPFQSDMLKEFLLWIQPLVYTLDFVFLALIIQKYKGFGVIYKRILNEEMSVAAHADRQKKFKGGHAGIFSGVCLGILWEVSSLGKWILRNDVLGMLSQQTLFLLPIILLVLFLLVFNTVKNKGKQTQLKASGSQLVTYSTLLNTLSSEEEDYREAIEKILNQVEKYIEQEDMESLKCLNQSFADLNEKLDISTYKFLMSLRPLKHKIIKGVLMSKFSKINAYGIDFEASIGDGVEHLNISSVELSRIIGVLVDNAIEAAVESERKHVVDYEKGYPS